MNREEINEQVALLYMKLQGAEKHTATQLRQFYNSAIQELEKADSDAFSDHVASPDFSL